MIGRAIFHEAQDFRGAYFLHFADFLEPPIQMDHGNCFAEQADQQPGDGMARLNGAGAQARCTASTPGKARWSTKLTLETLKNS